MFGILNHVQSVIVQDPRVLSDAVSRWTKPIADAPLLDTVADLARAQTPP